MRNQTLHSNYFYLLISIMLLSIAHLQLANGKESEGLIEEKPPNLREKKMFNELMRLPKDGRAMKGISNATNDNAFWAWLQANPDPRKRLADHMVDGGIKGLKLNDESEFKKLMDSLGIKYSVDKDGDADIIFDYTDVSRKQQVWVSSRLTDVGNYKLRKVFSYAYDGPEAPSLSVMTAALTDNNALDTSRWSLKHSEKDGRYVVMLTALVPVTADSATLASIVRGVASRADNFEKAHYEPKGK